MDSNRRRAVLTGGTGFLGSHLAERLLDLGIDVLCIDNFVTSTPHNVSHLLDRQGFQLLRADVTEQLSISGPIDYVLHFASPASPIDYNDLPIETLKVNSVGTLHTLGLAKANGARYLLASTSETYGEPLVHPQPETYWGNVNPVGPRACYDEAKRFAEALTMAYRTFHGVNTAIMRIFNTYGPRMRADDGRAVPNFITQALSGLPITVAGDGSQTRSLCYIDDLVEGALSLLFSDKHGPVNIGNPGECTVLELATTVRRIVRSESPIVFVPRPQDDPTIRRPDIGMARDELGWTPKVDLADGLGRTVQWFRDQLDQHQERSAVLANIQGAAYDPSPRSRRIAVVGTGYVGAVTATCLAWLGNQVHGLDIDPTRTQQLSDGDVPFYEPGLKQLLAETLPTGRLKFSTGISDALVDAEVIYLCVGTPQSANGTVDLSQFESALHAVAPCVRTGTVIINKSTVPVGCGNLARTILENALPAETIPEFHLVSNPEFLREGSAIEDFLHPDRIVLGGESLSTGIVADLYRPIIRQAFEGGRPWEAPVLITTDLASAEMIKYAANVFLATKISLANEIALLCEFVGADARQVMPAVGADPRIGSEFLSLGVGWGGSCFGKDLVALMATGQEYGYSAAILQAVKQVNDYQRAGILHRLQRRLRLLKGRRIAILGLAFKPGTDDLRDAPAIEIARRLLAVGAHVAAYDPVVKQLPLELAAVRMAHDPYDAATRADAVVVITEWPEFAELAADKLSEVMAGSLVLDGRNMLDVERFSRAAILVEGIGW